ncbi:MAG: polysaccharide biosynthesis protein [Clostridiales bacterium]|nr:polysaccharide biosynthesis protein [Clostridiales bacterium]
MKKSSKITAFVALDIFSVVIAWVFSILLVEMNIGDTIVENAWWFASTFVFAIAFSLVFGLYANIWKYAGIAEGIKIVCASACMGVWFIVISLVSNELRIGWAIIMTALYFAELVATRFIYRFYVYFMNRLHNSGSHHGERVIVIGGGAAGVTLIRELKTSDKLKMYPVCVLDDDKNKIGQFINGVKIVGTTTDVKYYAKEYNASQIIIAIPTATKKEISNIVNKCKDTGCKVKIIPGTYQFATGELSASAIKDVSITDLLGREQVSVNLDEIMGYIEDQVVLVTGGGGSIGSELCRQIADHSPKQLIIFDIYENNAYDIQQELLSKHKDLNLLVLIGSVRDSKKVNDLFKKYKPAIVFHAAAHKHVPLMETSPNEAVKNNVSGTFKVAEAAGKNGVKRFILISTDKAVNPTNIMGATKRICEMIIQTMNNRYDTEYVAVRFGNVLGSNGSVIPLFRRQIQEGGPVTITDKRIVRYFMTIPEAVSLVLQAGAYAKGGEIFVLDMGEPVKIYDLAVNMIKLSGFTPYEDIDIKVIGLRPGEKLYEERLMEEEGLQKTANDMISIGKPLDIDEENLFNKIKELYEQAYNETDKMKQLVHELVPTYTVDNRE